MFDLVFHLYRLGWHGRFLIGSEYICADGRYTANFAMTLRLGKLFRLLNQRPNGVGLANLDASEGSLRLICEHITHAGI